MNNAYLYYLDSTERLSELLVSYESLKRTAPKYQVYCMCGPEIVNEKIFSFFREIGILPLITNKPLHLYLFDDDGNWYSRFICFGKLDIFNLTMFDKVVFLGTDTYITKNIDELFDYPDGSMATHHVNDYNGMGANGDVFVVTPNKETMKNIMQIIKEDIQNYNFRYLYDQEFLENYYNHRNNPKLHLNYMYNMIIPNINDYENNPLFDYESVKIFHFLGAPKVEDKVKLDDFPNMHGGTNYNLSNKIIKEYLTFYDEVIDRYKLKYPYMPLANSVHRSVNNVE